MLTSISNNHPINIYEECIYIFLHIVKYYVNEKNVKLFNKYLMSDIYIYI